MSIEYKAFHAATKAMSDRTVIGIAAVHGVIDDGRDRSWPGAFADMKINGRDRARFLWQHNDDPPIAAIDYVKEVNRAELPAIVLQYAPEATGGVEVSRTYLDTPRGNEVLAGIRAGAICEMSYAYEVAKSGSSEDENGPIRELYALKVYDFSDVIHGMNGATSGAMVKALALGTHGDVVKAAIAAYITRVHDLAERRSKEGRMFSSANYAALKGLADDLESSITQLRELLKQSDPKATAIDVQRLMLESQQALAYVQGITYR